MTNNFCTVFDINYLVQGLALYNSLLKNCKNAFTLYCLCMDEEAYAVLLKLNLDNLKPISLNELKDCRIDKIKKRVSHGQLCWICQPLIIQHLFDYYSLKSTTYLEADSFFFNDPQILIEEIGELSVSLVPHNFSKKHDNVKEAGLYCVQFNYFKNDTYGLRVLEYWKNNCYNYSSNKLMDFPGQLCLNNWPLIFDNVAVINHLGAGVAPWNVQDVTISKKQEKIYINDYPVVFFHFHQYGIYKNGDHELGQYPLTENVISLLYKPYIVAIEHSMKMVKVLIPEFNARRVYDKKINGLFIDYLIYFKRKMLGRYNVKKSHFHK